MMKLDTPTEVRTYPLGSKRNMVEFICHTGVSNRSVYKDANGDLWEQDLSVNNPWYSKVKPAQALEYLERGKNGS
jgi:hypothetical protein